MSSNNRRTGIFVATMTGLAEMCAEEIEGALTAAGHNCDRFLMDGLDANKLIPFSRIIVVSSTYGHGEIPDNGQSLFASIASGFDLAGKDYIIFALGDRTYADTFCAAGDSWDAVLADSGARRVMDIMRHDASSGTLAEDVAGEWAAGWARLLTC